MNSDNEDNDIANDNNDDNNNNKNNNNNNNSNEYNNNDDKNTNNNSNNNTAKNNIPLITKHITIIVSSSHATNYTYNQLFPTINKLPFTTLLANQ